MKRFGPPLAAALLLAATVGLTASAARGPNELRFACAAKRGGLWHYVSGASKCPARTGTLIRLPGDGPIGACERRRASRQVPAGAVRRITAPTLCQRSERPLTISGSARTYFCAAKRGGLLRHVKRRTRCRGSERFVFADKAPLNRAPVAAPDSSATDEDHAGSIAVLANDTDSDGDALHVDSLDTSGTAGTAAIQPDGSVRYDPAGRFDRLKPGETATDTFSYRASDGRAGSAPATVTITVTGVNDPPQAAGDSASTGEFQSAAIPLLANDTDPEGDAVHVAGVDTTGTKGTVTVNPDGSVTYDPNGQFALAVGESAHDTFTYTAADGAATSRPATVDVTVNGTTQPPVLAGIEGTALAYNTGTPSTPITATLAVSDADSPDLAGATIAITSGYAAGHDTLTFTNQNGISGSFDAATGTLSLSGTSSVANYQAALRSVGFQADGSAPGGSRSVGFLVTDGTANSNMQSRSVTVTHVNHTPVATNDTFNPGTIGNTKLAVGTTASGPKIQISGSVLSNDSDPDGSAGLTATATSPTATGAKVSMNSDGTFTYVPPQGFTGNDTFGYTLHDNDPTDPKTSTATVTVNVAGPVVWYVDNSLGSIGDGRSDAPFNTLAPLTTGGAADAKDGSGDVIFLYQGSGNYTGGIVLEQNQQLTGQPQGLTVSGHSLVAAGGSNPTVANSGGDAIDLANGADVERVDVGGTTSGTGIKGVGVTNATVGTNTTIGGATGGAFALSGSAGGTVSVGSAIANTSGPAVSISGRTGGTVTLSGAVTDSAGGVSLSSNTGATIGFTGALHLTRTTGDVFSATGGGTVTATNIDNTASTGSGAAIRIANTTIGASGISFKSASSSGGTNGIALDATGSTAGLTVSGSGTASSGGTISNSTGDAISLNSTRSPSFNYMNIQTPQHAGIQGVGVTNFTLTHSTINGAGAAANDATDSSVGFNDTAGGTNNNVDGAVTITNNTLSNAYGSGVDIFNHNGTISDANISNNNVSSSANATNSKGRGISLHLYGSSTTVASLTKAEINSNTVTNFPSGDGIEVLGSQTNVSPAPAGSYGTPTGSTPGTGTNIVQMQSNQVIGDATTKMNGPLLQASITGRGSGNFDISNNGTGASPVRNTVGEGISIGTAGAASGNFNVTGNTLQPNSQSGATGIGISVLSWTMADASVLKSAAGNFIVNNNTVSGTSGKGIWSILGDINGSENIKIQNNNVGNPAQNNPGIRVDSGQTGDVATNPTLCSTITGNTSGTGPADGGGNIFPGILLRKRSTSSTTYLFGIAGLSPSPATQAQTESFVSPLNAGSATGAGFYAGKKVAADVGNNWTSCTLPF